MVFDPEIKASKEPAKNGYGQTGYLGASALLPGQTKPSIPSISPPTVKTPNMNGPAAYNGIGDNERLAQIKDEGTFPAAHPSMAIRAPNSGSPSGRVPSAPLHRDSGKSLSPATFDGSNNRA
jgi:hypothetical protein